MNVACKKSVMGWMLGFRKREPFPRSCFQKFWFRNFNIVQFKQGDVFLRKNAIHSFENALLGGLPFSRIPQIGFMSVARFSWVPNLYNIHFLVENHRPQPDPVNSYRDYVYIYHPNPKSTNLQYFDEKNWKDSLLSIFHEKFGFLPKVRLFWKLLKTSCFHGFGRDLKRYTWIILMFILMHSYFPRHYVSSSLISPIYDVHNTTV